MPHKLEVIDRLTLVLIFEIKSFRIVSYLDFQAALTFENKDYFNNRFFFKNIIATEKMRM